MNWRLTFGDQRRGGQGPRHYLEFALLSGCVMFCVRRARRNRSAECHRGPRRGAGGDAAERPRQPRPPPPQPLNAAWVAIHHGVQGGLARLADEVGADRPYLLPARGDASSGLPEGLLAHVIAHRRPMLLTEAASYRAQRRSKIETASRMLSRWSAITVWWRWSYANASLRAGSRLRRSRQRHSRSPRSSPS